MFRVAPGDEGLGEVDEKIRDIPDRYETGNSYEENSNDMIKKMWFPNCNEAEMSREYFQFKDVIKEHALLNGRDIRLNKNYKVRCKVVCKGRKEKCKWMYFASNVGGSNYFRIKTLNEKHTCGRNYNVKLASSNWISKKISNNISQELEVKISTVIQTIQDKYMTNMSVGKDYWARIKALEEVHGRKILQYAKLRNYCTEILRRGLLWICWLELVVVCFGGCVVCLSHMLVVQYLRKVITLKTIAITTTTQHNILPHIKSQYHQLTERTCGQRYNAPL
ncbi:hypothetical protein Ahy_A03g013773 isoform A [Arachis hypogaea]|uniref:Uncharacterized protein n=1 Tax=Arachis hypogaea TaxID=3818 RepID=A0A445DW67_ARAHY|nr:hypothetical protein Ahy_A03g013773 isoform A [Arachis hypogaea]